MPHQSSPAGGGNPAAMDGVRDALLLALGIMVIVLIVVLARSRGSQSLSMVCHRGNLTIDCKEVLQPGMPGYVPPINETQLNESLQAILSGVRHG